MDCSKTIDFFSELKRLCGSCGECEADAANKEQCPLYDFCRIPYSKACAEDAKKAIEDLQKWSDEHPQKTYAQDFFEKFPDAQSDSDGFPYLCRQTIYGGECPSVECDECWNEPMEE